MCVELAREEINDDAASVLECAFALVEDSMVENCHLVHWARKYWPRMFSQDRWTRATAVPWPFSLTVRPRFAPHPSAAPVLSRDALLHQIKLIERGGTYVGVLADAAYKFFSTESVRVTISTTPASQQLVARPRFQTRPPTRLPACLCAF